MKLNKEKQIEEIGKILCRMKNSCDGCMWDKVYCNERDYAEEIYNAGYREASEVAREIFVEIDNILDYLKIFNSCDDILNAIVYRITKLKKKYTEDENDEV